MASQNTKRALPQKQLPEGIKAVPTGLTAISTKYCVVFQATVANTTAGALTLLLEDAQSSPLPLLPTISVAANSVSIISWPEGIACLGGLSWQASGAGLSGEVFGFTE